MSSKASKSAGLDIGLEEVAAVYTKALFDAAQESGSTLDVLVEFEAFVTDVLDDMSEFESILVSPHVPAQAKIDMLDKALAGKMTQVLLDFMKVVARRGRMKCLRVVCRMMRELYNESYGRVAVEIQTVEPLDSQTLALAGNAIRTALQSEIDLSVELNPDLIGGVVIRVGDKIFDGSVINQLARLREKAYETSIQELRKQREKILRA